MAGEIYGKTLEGTTEHWGGQQHAAVGLDAAANVQELQISPKRRLEYLKKRD